MELSEAMKKEEIIWKQKSRINWLTTTDLNMSFFHLSTIIRRRRNNIETLKNSGGGWLHNRDEIGNHIVNFFKELYSSPGANGNGEIGELIQPVITAEDNKVLCALPTVKEIRDAVFRLGLIRPRSRTGSRSYFFNIIGRSWGWLFRIWCCIFSDRGLCSNSSTIVFWCIFLRWSIRCGLINSDRSAFVTWLTRRSLRFYLLD